MNIKLYLGLLIALFVVISVSYWRGYDRCNEAWKLKTEQAMNEQLLNIKKIETENREVQSKIARDYEEQINEIKNKHLIEINSLNLSKLSDIRVFNNCDANKDNLPRDATDTRKLTCYTEDELLGKIRASVVIVSECQQELIRCNKLVEAVRNR